MLFVLLIGGFAFLYWYRRRAVSWKKLDQMALEEFGHTREERRENIEAFFEDELNTIDFFVDSTGPRIRCLMERNLLTMDQLEKEALKACLLLGNEGHFYKKNFYITRFGLIWGDKKGNILKPRKGPFFNEDQSGRDALSAFGHNHGISGQGSLSMLLRTLQNALKNDPDNPVLQSLRKTFVENNDFFITHEESGDSPFV